MGCNSSMNVNTTNTGYNSGIGPYSYLGWGNNLSNCSSCNESNCDISFKLDYGTRQWVRIDWSQELENSGSCKVMVSQWVLKDNSNIDSPKILGENIELNITSVLIEGGEIGTEYKLYNVIHTENGQILRKSICITVIGEIVRIPIYDRDDCDGKVLGYSSIPVSNNNTNVPINNNVSVVNDSQNNLNYFEEGIYTNASFGQNICNLTVRTVKGTATLIYNDSFNNSLTHKICEEGIILSNNDELLKQFFIKVDENSIICFEVKECQ